MQTKALLLGVNIDHIATVRQARGTTYPDPIEAALLAEKAGANGITAHLREDRRHIQDHDIVKLKQHIGTRLNLETAVTNKMIQFALEINPEHCCLVPEKREELTTEGGLDVITHHAAVKRACDLLQAEGIEVSLFIDPDQSQVDAAVNCGAKAIEIHTGLYADAFDAEVITEELERIKQAANYAAGKGLIVNAGHGLHYENVQAIAAIPELNELNIGHAIIGRAMMVGIEQAVTEMINQMVTPRKCEH
jgi:pyridoxine 5-phosphate synthase